MASQQPATTPAQREMVFCYECENEWYRDEHGLTCPECQSGFVEIIDHDHDPREEFYGQQEAADDMSEMFDQHNHDEEPGRTGDHRHPLHNHNPWTTDDDPEEQDISSLRWRQVEPGRFAATATLFSSSFVPVNSTNNRGGPQAGNGHADTGRDFLSMLTGIIGGAGLGGNPPPHNQTREPGQEHEDNQRDIPGAFPQQSETATPGQGNEGANNAGGTGGVGGAGNPRIGVFGGPIRGGHFTYHTTARIYPRDANNPQPHIEPVDDLSHVIGNIMMGLGGPGGPTFHREQGGDGNQPQMHPNPFAALFASVLNPGLASHGDFVFTQEALDRVVSQLMEQNTSGNAPGPASADVISSLPKRKIAVEDLGSDGRAECSICMDEVNIGEEVTVLPCSHWFHGPCVSAWLGEHDSCPHCRKSISPETNASTGGSQDPSRDPPNASSDTQGLFGNTGGHSNQASGNFGSAPQNNTAHGSNNDNHHAADGSGAFNRLRHLFSGR